LVPTNIDLFLMISFVYIQPTRLLHFGGKRYTGLAEDMQLLMIIYEFNELLMRNLGRPYLYGQGGPHKYVASSNRPVPIQQKSCLLVKRTKNPVSLVRRPKTLLIMLCFDNIKNINQSKTLLICAYCFSDQSQNIYWYSLVITCTIFLQAIELVKRPKERAL